MKQFQTQDVVRIISGKHKGLTGVGHRHPEGYTRACVFLKGSWLGVWYQVDELKKIGSTKRGNKNENQ